MLSMTGYGVGEAALGEGRVNLELRGLNHRYLDVRVRVPAELSDYAFFIEQHARERLSRGRFDIGVRIDGPSATALELDLARARAVYRALDALRDELGVQAPLSVAPLLNVPDLFRPPAGMARRLVEQSLVAAFEQARGHLLEMRASEGRMLENEVRLRFTRARELCTAISERQPMVVVAARERLLERLRRLLSALPQEVDPARVEAEAVLLTERGDITEELVRLRSHFEQLESLVEADEPIGRRMDFLLQETMREANTIGAKCQDATISHWVVELKSEIERLREQVQNVE